ncbi:hypothetical protein DE146DRAFT_751841 [Phaeosphaeria sp. MPI-PUGE-AT-0046c]|nr:hypothetical protein DE146DRAFT_751841 [Phaeosphaeria sp. MPI-PUGE-AT-0046c]
MKLSSIIGCIALATVCTSNTKFGLSPLNHSFPRRPHGTSALPNTRQEEASGPVLGAPDPSTVYGQAWCKGSRLMLATTQDAAGAATHVSPINSPWTGPLDAEMQLWGYKDETVSPNGDNSCDFEELGMGRVCASLGVSTKTRANGGPHKCYKIVHRDGSAVITQAPNYMLPEVSRQVYKVTNAKFELAVNAQDGMITFIDVQGPKSEAKRLWGNANPSTADLPALRALSDITWGLWNRDCASQQKSLNGISKILSVNIINDDTEAIVDEALSKLVMPPGQQRPDDVPPWPGITFDTSSEAGVAILGSPNGATVGFFLAQHKQQLGNKYVPRITAFMSEGDIWVLNLLMWIEDAPTPPPPPPPPMGLTGPGGSAHMGNVSESRVVKRSADGRNILREHIIHAKL